VVNDEILELELVGEFVNGVKHVVAFAVKVLRHRLQLLLGMLELPVQLLHLFRLEIEFFLQRRKLSMHSCDILLLLFKTLLEFSLHAHLVFQLLLGLSQLLLLLLRNFLGLRTHHHLLLHLLKLLDQLLLLCLCLFLLFFALTQLFNETLFLFLFEVSLVFNAATLSIGFLANLLLLLHEFLLKRLHLLFVLNHHCFLDKLGVSNDAVFTHEFCRVHP